MSNSCPGGGRLPMATSQLLHSQSLRPPSKGTRYQSNGRPSSAAQVRPGHQLSEPKYAAVYHAAAVQLPAASIPGFSAGHTACLHTRTYGMTDRSVQGRVMLIRAPRC
ncbi:hypothetical protein NDU88_009005 [Pleurodeles waltl]|uniref:Uncharacterized protein n=1 Tax=Pleurodeles waltl TaxID=8319 RepID=A0AAV7PUT8_PLEWA|nr:hypothetical protein NDU88_009005 [Pleurodeles waltl]